MTLWPINLKSYPNPDIQRLILARFYENGFDLLVPESTNPDLTGFHYTRTRTWGDVTVDEYLPNKEL